MKPIRSISILLIAAAGLFLATASSTLAATGDEASNYVQNIGSQALGVISNKAYNKEQKLQKLEAVFSSSVDFQWVGRFVMGRYWKQASEEQKNRYLSEYAKFLLLNYTSRFANYSGGSFKVNSSREDGDGEYTVSTQMQTSEIANGEPFFIDYRIHKVDKSYKIFDVIVEGVSLLTTQRTEFSSVINNKGIDYLINQLVEKSSLAAKQAADKNG
jgi:phospholipid transport system substrate-binding protein